VRFFDEREVKLSRALTGRGTKYCGNPEHHEYELYLAMEDIGHSRTKTKSPQTNAISARLHKTMLQNHVAKSCWMNSTASPSARSSIFRSKSCRTIPANGSDNEERPHQGRGCSGKTPAQTFLDAIPIAREKMIAARPPSAANWPPPKSHRP
jgi:hypothetical protein